MAGITKTVKVTKGEDISITFSNIKNSAGSTIDFTGATNVTYVVTSAQGSGSAVFTLGIGTGVSTPSTSFVVTITDTNTDLLSAGTYYHECKVTVGSTTYQVLDPSPFIVIGSSI